MTAPVVLPPRGGAPLLKAMEANLVAMRRKVQIAKKQLALTDDDYRAILLRVTGKTSSTECGPSQLDELLREFKRLGWKPATGKAGGKQRRPLSKEAQHRMIYAVWTDLRPHLAVGDESTLRAFVRRQTKTPAHPEGIDAVEFLDAAMANRVLEGLKAWLKRARAKAVA
jgi:phage gp16-like protein